MANTHQNLNEEIEITLKVRVKINHAFYYGDMPEVDLKEHIEEAKKDLKRVLIQKIENEYSSEELTHGVYYGYEVFNADK